MRTYTELSQCQTMLERFDYLKIGGRVGDTTFGFERWMNQQFYRSTEWRSARRFVLARDMGHDLGDSDAIIRGTHYIHHMNPLTAEDIENGSDNLFNPEGLISASMRLHNAVHWGDERLLPQPYVERSPGDTDLW